METNMISNKILITGSSGFIGANLVRRLILQNHEIYIFTRKNSDKWRIKDLLPAVHEIEIDFMDRSLLNKHIKDIKPEIIFHLAAYGGYPFQNNLDSMIEANIVSTSNLLQESNSIDYKIFINTGSSSEYGYKNKPMIETDPLIPASFYASTKAATTYLCQVFAKLYSKPITTVRPFSVYGPFEEKTRLIPKVIVASLQNKDIQLTTGKEQRDFIYIDDFIDCIIKIADNPQKATGEIFNIGSGEQHGVKDVVSRISKLTKSKSKLLWGAYKPRAWDTDYWVGDISKVKKIIGWESRTTLNSGLRQTIDWFDSHIHLYT